MDDLQTDIEARLAALDPRVELIALQRPGRETLRLFVDHPDGVTLDLCERVTAELRDLLVDYSLEVSSPGLDRPLTKPEHYERFLGHRVRVRTREPIAGSRSFTGRLTAADAERVSVESDAGEVEIPLARVHRSNLVPEPSEVQL